jgi:hypothetical protein
MAGSGVVLNFTNDAQGPFHGNSEIRIQVFQILDYPRRIPVSRKQGHDLLIVHRPGNCPLGDLEPIGVQDRDNRSGFLRVNVLRGVPRCSCRSRLSFAVSNDTRHDKIRIIHHGSPRNRQRISEFPALVDAAGTLRIDVTGKSAWDRESRNQFRQTAGVDSVVGIKSTEGALEPEGRENAGGAVARSADVHHVQVVFLNESVAVCVDERETGTCCLRAGQLRGVHVPQ